MASQMDWASTWLQVARCTEGNGCLASVTGAHCTHTTSNQHLNKARHLVSDETVLASCRCGALIDMKPFHKKVDEGMDPDAAWQEAKSQVEMKIKYGTWATDFFVSGPEQSARFCHIDEIR